MNITLSHLLLTVLILIFNLVMNHGKQTPI